MSSLRPEEDPRVDPADRAQFLVAWAEHREVHGCTLLAELPYGLRHALHNHADLDGVDYDLVGKIQSVNDPTGTYSFAYDNMGRLIGTTTNYSSLPGRTVHERLDFFLTFPRLDVP